MEENLQSSTFISNIILIGTTVAAVFGFLIRQWYKLTQLGSRVKKLESKEESILSDYMTKEEHKEKQHLCSMQVYKDMGTLEAKIEKIDQRIERSEAQREKAREEDLKWKRDMQEVMVEIRTIVKKKLF